MVAHPLRRVCAAGSRCGPGATRKTCPPHREGAEQEGQGGGSGGVAADGGRPTELIAVRGTLLVGAGCASMGGGSTAWLVVDPTGSERASRTSWCRPTRTRRRTTSTSSSPTSIRPHREAVAAFGDMSSVAISMFGGIDPGEIDDSDPVRAVATRRLAGMGVDTDRRGWLARQLQHRLGACRATATAGGWPCSRSRASTPRSPTRARCWRAAFAGHVPGAEPLKGLELVWPALHGYNRWLADFCAAAPGPAGRMHPDRPPRHGPGRRGDRLGPRRRDLRRGHAPGHVGHVRAAWLRRRLLRAVLERLRGPRDGGQPPHRRVGRPPTPKYLYDASTAACSGSTRCSSSPGGRCGS